MFILITLSKPVKYLQGYSYLSNLFPFPIDRSSRPKVFCKKDVLKNFAKFTGIHLCQGLFFNKVAGLRNAHYFNA